MTFKNTKVIFDTNVWISFLIGKRLKILKKYISSGNITIVINGQLMQEIKEVTSREKLKKYFPPKSVDELIELLNIIAKKFQTEPIHFILKDKKDNFLLDLIDVSKADYLVTGDKELLKYNSFKTAAILTPADFEKELNQK